MTALVAEGRESDSRRERVTAPVLVAGAVLGASVVLHLRDPHQSGSYLFCPWLVLTGTYCPGCGGLRAVNDLTRGDVAAAASSNLLLAGAVPLLLFMWSRWFLDRWRGVRRVVDQRRGVLWASLFGLVSLLYWVVRNLPGLEWLTP
ncbi:MAG TPA: DUF2752 domain-containing protein [Nocardioidaceae bacterium]|nr:DUF2752 domain-containing protein [Nocardioidaceae bacterium]